MIFLSCQYYFTKKMTGVLFNLDFYTVLTKSGQFGFFRMDQKMSQAFFLDEFAAKVKF